MYSDSQEICRVSQNLSLRKSPERKYASKNYFQPSYSSNFNNYSRLRNSKSYKCYPINCCNYIYYNFCCYPCCCCCCFSNFDYNSKVFSNKYSSIYPSNKIDDPNRKSFNKYGYLNSSTIKGSTKNQTYNNPQIQPGQEQNNQINSNSQNTYFSYEQNQFNDFLKKLMEIESKIENAKINLASDNDFNCEDAFRLFETNNKGYLDENDIKNGLQLIGLNASDLDVKLLMKRFDLQKRGNINYADFFDIIVPFEKNERMKVEARLPKSSPPYQNPDNFPPSIINGLKELFNLIIGAENEINDMRKLFGTLRLNLRDIFGLLDKNNQGFFTNNEFMEYLENNRILDNNRDADLLFIRLDKNRNGKIDYPEIEDEIQTLY